MNMTWFFYPIVKTKTALLNLEIKTQPDLNFDMNLKTDN